MILSVGSTPRMMEDAQASQPKEGKVTDPDLRVVGDQPTMRSRVVEMMARMLASTPAATRHHFWPNLQAEVESRSRELTHGDIRAVLATECERRGWSFDQVREALTPPEEEVG